MKILLVGLCAWCVLGGGQPSASAQTPEVASSTPQEALPDAGGKRVREFQGDDIGQVLRLLARQAKINLAVGEAVRGNVSVRLESASALDAIEILVRSRKLVLTRDDKGAYYIDEPEPTAEALDLLAKPEAANQVAAYKRHLYEALIKQGFRPDEALQLTAADGAGSIPALFARKPEPVPAK